VGGRRDSIPATEGAGLGAPPIPEAGWVGGGTLYLLLKGRAWVLRLFLRPGGRGRDPEAERTCRDFASSGTQLI
jgi:hypothetical protein